MSERSLVCVDDVDENGRLVDRQEGEHLVEEQRVVEEVEER
jgi:hypothetical protein